MGTTYKGLTVEIDGDTSKFTQAIKQTTTALKTAETQARKLQRASRWDDAAQARTAANSIESLSAQLVSAASKQDLLSKAIEKNKSLLSSQGTNSKRVSQDLANSTTQYALLEKQLESYHTHLKELDKTANGDNAKYSKKMANWDTYVPELLKKSGYSDSEAENYVSSIKMAQSAFNMFKKDMKEAKLGEAFVDAKSEAAALKEKINQAAQAYVKMTEKANSAKIGKTLKGYSAQAKAAEIDLAELERESKTLSTQLQGSPSKGKAFMLLGNYQEQQKQLTKFSENTKAAQKDLQVSEPYKAKSKSELAADYSKTTSNLSKLVAAQERLRSEESALITQQKRLKAELNTSGVSEDALNSRRAALSDTTARLTLVQTKLGKANSVVQETETSLNDIQIAQKYQALGTASSNAKTKVDELNGSISKMGEKVGSSGIVTLGRTLVQTASPLATTAMYSMVNAADTIDAAYRDMRKTVNGTEEQFESLRQSALEFSKQSVVSADTILEIEAMGGQLGIAAGSLESFAETVSNLDIATNMDSDTIAEDLGKLGSVLGMDNDDYAKFGDALVRLGNNFPALEGDVMEITTRFAGVGKVVGMSASQMLAWSTAATATGAKSEAAGSSMQRLITDMETAATKGDKNWAKLLGMDSKEFQKAFDSDASGTMYKFIAALGDLQANNKSVNQELTELGITGVRDKQLIEGLAQQYANGGKEANTLAQALEAAQTAWDGQPWNSKENGLIEAGDAMREAEQKSEGLSGSLGRLQNIGSAALNSLGDSAAPALADLADAASEIESVFEGLPNEAKLAITAFTGLTAVSGPIINLAGGMSQAWQSLTSVEAKAAKAQNQAAKLAKLQNSMVFGGFVEGIDAAAYGRKLENVAKGTEKMGMKARMAGVQIKALSAAARVGKLAIAGMGAALAAFYVDQGVKYITHLSNMKKATTDLTSSIQTAAVKSQGLKAITSVSGTAAKSVSEIAESQAELAQSQKDSTTELLTKTKTAENAYQTIKDSWGKKDTNSLTSMKLAVQQLNEALGTDYTVNEETGKIDSLGKSWKEAKKALTEYINEKKRQLAIDAYGDMYKDALEAEQEAKSTYEDTKNRESELGSNAVDEAKKTLDSAKENRKKLDSLQRALSNGTTTGNDENLNKWNKASTSDVSFLSGFDRAEKWQSQMYKSGMTADVWNSIKSKDGLKENLTDWFNEGGIDEAVAGLNQKYGTKLKSVGSEWGSSIEVGLQEKMAQLGKANAAGMSFKEMKTDLKGLGVEATDSDAIEGYIKQISSGKSRIEAAWETVKDSLNGTGITQDVFTNLFNNNGGDFSKVMAQIDQYKKQLSGLGDDAQITVSVNDDGSLSVLDQTEQKAQEVDGTEANLFTIVQGVPDAIMRFGVAEAGADELDGKTAEISVSTNGAESSEQSLDSASSAAAAAQDNGNVTITVSTTGAESAVEKLGSVGKAAGGIPKTVTTNTIINQTTKKTEKIQPSILSGGNTSASKVKVTADTSSANSAIKETSKNASNIKDKTINVKAKTDSAISDLKSVKRVLDGIQSKSVTVTTKKRTVKDGNAEQAHGGIFVPNRKFATGGIVTHPMYSAHGLVGEAGTEAIIPLSNGHYVKPFARAVANQMQQVSSQPVVNNYYSVGNVTASDGSQVALAVKQLQRAIRMEQRS